jgi:hypothetical protein
LGSASPVKPVRMRNKSPQPGFFFCSASFMPYQPVVTYSSLSLSPATAQRAVYHVVVIA